MLDAVARSYYHQDILHLTTEVRSVALAMVVDLPEVTESAALASPLL